MHADMHAGILPLQQLDIAFFGTDAAYIHLDIVRLAWHFHDSRSARLIDEKGNQPAGPGGAASGQKYVPLVLRAAPTLAALWR